MEPLFIPTEADFRRWIREELTSLLPSIPSVDGKQLNVEEPFISRKEIAKKLAISLVTLTDWVKRGLPAHKLRGRVYFLESEVRDYIRSQKSLFKYAAFLQQ